MMNLLISTLDICCTLTLGFPSDEGDDEKDRAPGRRPASSSSSSVHGSSNSTTIITGDNSSIHFSIHAPHSKRSRGGAVRGKPRKKVAKVPRAESLAKVCDTLQSPIDANNSINTRTIARGEFQKAKELADNVLTSLASLTAADHELHRSRQATQYWNFNRQFVGNTLCTNHCVEQYSKLLTRDELAATPMEAIVSFISKYFTNCKNRRGIIKRTRADLESRSVSTTTVVSPEEVETEAKRVSTRSRRKERVSTVHDTSQAHNAYHDDWDMYVHLIL